jgi:hypothetical protein
MTVAAIQQVLQPITFTKTISVVSAASSTLLNHMGMQVGGPNERFYGHGREGSYRIFNNTRNTALETAPDMPAARRPRLPVGIVPFVYPRMYEEFSLNYEEIHNFSKIDDPRVRDIAGEAYIQKQSIAPGQRHANWRAALVTGMLRDSLYLQESGGYWYPSYSSSGNIARRNFNLPSGNLNQCNIVDFDGNSINGGPIIDVPWSDPMADIPLHCALIDAALFRRHGVHLTDIFLRSKTWNMVTNNKAVQTGAGISQPPFENFQRAVGTNPDGSPKQVWMASINKVPGVTWHVLNDGRNIGPPGSETFQYDIEDNCALFLPEANSMTFEGLTGSEPVVERDGMPAVVKQGYSAWTYLAANPSRYQAFQLDNFLPVPYMPGSWCYGTVAGFTTAA